MRRLIDNDWLTVVSRLFIGVVFIWAAFYKIVEPISFAKSIWYYHLVPGQLVNLIALILPWLELLCGLALILGVFYRGAVLWINILLVVFVIALASTIIRGISIDCGCFKEAESGTDLAIHALLFDILCLVFSLQLFLSRSRRWMLSSK